jgi:hypothetical protein
VPGKELQTLLSSPAGRSAARATQAVQLAPYAVWVASVH